ncbi:MAG: hypothetical protein ACTSQG_04970 [Promethearchaeota archaeon]
MQLIPKWTKKGKLKEGGRDPLGLSAISERITSDLVPGIITMTRIARNYIFYCWSLKVAIKKKFKTLNEFKQHLAKLEAAWVIGGLLDDNATGRDGKGAIGTQRAMRRITLSSEDEIDVNFSVFKMKGGGFYQYHRSSMAQLGLVITTKYLPVLLPNGEKLANFYESNIKTTTYFKNYLNIDVIPKSVLLEYGQKSHFNYLKNTKNENTELIKIFFSKNETSSEIPYSRRDTLVLLLDLINLFEQNNLILTENDFRNIIFYNRTENIKNCFYSSINLEKILAYWRFFVFHNFFTFFLEHLLVCFIESTKKDSGQSIDEFYSENKEITSILSEYCKFDLNDKNILQIINLILLNCDVKRDFGPKSSELFDKKVNIDSKFSEYILCKKISESLSKEQYTEVLAFSLLLLLIIVIRFRHYIENFDDETIWMRDLCDTDRLNLFHFNNEVQLIANKISLFDFFKSVMDKIILQHDIIAQEKQLSYGLNTFRFERIGNSFHFKQGLEYSQRNSKFNALTSILEDLGLIILNSKECRLTSEGKNLLKKHKE